MLHCLLRLRTACQDCKIGLLSRYGCNEGMRFLEKKNMPHTEDGGLYVPSEAVLKAVQKMEMVFDQICLLFEA
ncbi:hypothetical protein BOX15_Mlig030918g1 [Macrostomum lignano]|uniref:Uncharacterized protein n=1 Tax=Macrostomum lignano TaxID=282301 RepID=A0A267FPE4_9PLAT|nr:hypothetical protein BOX15_Mlig030918g1 [Macrostomum lignano]